MFGKKKSTKSTSLNRSEQKEKNISTKSKKSAPFVRYNTIWKSVGGGFSNPGESKVCRVGKYKVLVSRADRLNKYGNPVHTATLINSDGSVGASYRSDGSATLVVSRALERNGIGTKRSAGNGQKKRGKK